MIEKLNGTRETVIHPDIPNVRLYINTQDENYPIHWHTDLEIIMAIENIYTIVIDKQTYIINPGDIIIIPSGEIHELFAPPTGKRIIILIDNSILNNFNGIDSMNHGFYPCVIIRNSQDNPYYQKISTLLQQLTEEYVQRQPLCEASIYSLAMYFFVILGRNSIKKGQNNSISKKKKHHEYVDKFLNVCKYINDHCTEDITTDELANLAGFSKYHFLRLFFDFSGVTLNDYIIKRRIIFAEALLCDPDLSIVEIAMQSGFNSLATFNRNFRAIKKCTPSEYRSMYNSQLYNEAPTYQ